MLDTEATRIKKTHNKICSTSILQSMGINIEIKNNGIHIIVDNKIDFWPTTGKYIVRKNQKKGRGVFNMIKELKRTA